MKKLFLPFILILFLLQFFLVGTLLQAKNFNWTVHKINYQKDHNYKSLNILTKHLKVGMAQNEVEIILGEPDYSPTEGQHYYSSNQKNRIGFTLGLVVEYEAGRLKSFELMPIGE